MSTKPDFPYCYIEDNLGEIKASEWLCPDTYYISVIPHDFELPCEYYIFPRDSTVFSDGAKAYGVPLPNHQELLSVMLGISGSGSTVIQYEAIRYKLRNGIALNDNEDIHVVAIYGMETNPEYFGEYPAPLNTPHGAALRYRKIFHGVFAIETERGERMIVVAYPLWVDDISEYTRRLGLQTFYDLTHDIHSTYGYLFFQEDDGCLALFELAKYHEIPPEIINMAALKNAVFQHFPDYAIQHNQNEVIGRNDGFGLLVQSMGVDRELSCREERLISWTPGKGIQYLLW